MTAPSKSLRPKKRTQKAMDAEERRRARAADSEGSTRSIDNLNMQERKTMTSPDKKAYGGKMKKVKKMNVGGATAAAVRKLKGISDGPTARGTDDRRANQMVADADAVRAKFAERGESGKAEASKQNSALVRKAIDDLNNVDRYGKDAPKGRSFGQKTRPKQGEMKTQKGKKVTAKAYGGKMEKVKKMASGGNVCRGMGAAKRGGKFSMG